MDDGHAAWEDMVNPGRETHEMNAQKQYAADVESILSHRFDNGGDLWTTPDKRLIKGSPFSTLECT